MIGNPPGRVQKCYKQFAVSGCLNCMKMCAEWRIYEECLGSKWRKISYQSQNMKSTCRLMFCSKLYCSIDFAVGYCRCRNKDSDTKTVNVKIVDTNEGKFGVNREGCWTFITAKGHKWMVEKRTDPQGSEVETADLGVMNKENGFAETPTDSVSPIFPRVQLVKSRVMKKRQASVLIVIIHTSQ